MANKSFMVTLKEYAEFTTINGVLYVFDSKFSRLSQVFWFLVGIALIAISILLIQQGYNGWQSDPILTTVSTTGYPISEIDYPAITICGLGMVDSVIKDAILKQVIEYIEIHRRPFNPVLDNGESYLDLFINNGLHYADFVMEEYPNMSINLNLTELFLLQGRNYILNIVLQKCNTYMKSDQNDNPYNSLRTLLKNNKLTWNGFMSETFPNLKPGFTAEEAIGSQMAEFMSKTVNAPFMSNYYNASAEYALYPTDYYDIFTFQGVKYADFMDAYYPYLPNETDPKDLLVNVVFSYIQNKTSLALDYINDPLEMFDAYHLNYSLFLATYYSGASVAANIPEIMENQVDKFIMQKTELQTTLRGNQTYKDLFAMNRLNYSDFINKMYPGLDEDTNLNDLIPLLASPRPDSFLQSKVAISGQYNSTQLINLTVTGHCDSNDYEYDAVNNICYRFAGIGSMSRIENGEFCNVENQEELVSFDNYSALLEFRNIVNNSGRNCDINPTEKINCLPGYLQGSTNYEHCTKDWNCCYDPSTSPACFYPASINILKANNEENVIFLTEDAYQLGYFGIAMWTKQDIDILNSSSQRNAESNGKDINLIYKGDSNSNCLSIIWESLTELIFMKTSCKTPFLVVICKKSGISAPFHLVQKKATFLDNIINPELAPQLKSRLDHSRNLFKNMFEKLDFEKSYTSLSQMLWYSQLPCFETGSNSISQSQSLLKRCEWKGVELPCAAIFKTFPTDRGMCCTFNMATAEEIFYNTTYRKTIIDMQEVDRNGTDGAIFTDIPDFSPDSNRPIPQAGINKGLSLILDGHSDLLSSGSVTEDFQGFLAIIASSNEYPLLNEKSICIQPGHFNSIGISATDVISTENIRSVAAEQRNCYFSDEYKLALHRNYSQANCILECQMSYASSMISKQNGTTCIPWYLPKNDTTVICDPWIAQEFVDFMANIDECDNCLPDCISTDYDVEVTAVPFQKCDEKTLGVSLLCNLTNKDIDPPIFAQQLDNEYGNNTPSYANRTSNIRTYNNDSSKAVFLKMVGVTYDAYVEDIAVVSFYFSTSTVEQLSRDVTMSWTDFAGQIGGFLGLCNGFSLCSLVEVFFWFTFRLWYNATKN